MKSLLLLAGVGLVLGVSVAQAQTTTTTTPATPTTPMHRPHFFPFFGMGGYGSSDYGSSGYAEHPATIEQAAAYGLAKIIRAEADYQKESSLAAKNWADARKYELDNWKKWVETYYEVRRINREARAAERGRPMTEADYIRLAQIGKPRRLTPSEMDVVTGQLNWPLLLQATDFVAYRDMLDQVFSNRAYRGTMGLDDYVKAEQTAESMMDLLRGRIEEVRPAEYVVARRFLESLAYEAGCPPPMTAGRRTCGRRGDEQRRVAILPLNREAVL